MRVQLEIIMFPGGGYVSVRIQSRERAGLPTGKLPLRRAMKVFGITCLMKDAGRRIGCIFGEKDRLCEIALWDDIYRKRGIGGNVSESVSCD